MVRLKFSGRGLADLDFWTKSDPFLTLSRPNRRRDGQVQIRKTETIMNNLNPDWKLLYVSLSELCDNDFNMMLKIDVWDEDKSSRNDLIGSVQVTLGMLQKLAQSKAALPLVKEAEGLHRRKEGRGNLLVMECLVEETPVMPRKVSVPGNYPAPSRLHHSAPPPQTRWRVTIAAYPQTETPPPPHNNHHNHNHNNHNHQKYQLNSFGHNSTPARISQNHITTIQELPDSEVSTAGQVNPGQWSQLAMAPMVAPPSNGDPYDIPRTRMGAPLAIPEVPVFHQQMPGTQMPYQGEQVSFQGVPPNSGTPYNNQFPGHHPSDPGDSRPMWVPPSPY